jgi:Domain of unknown function (DUF1707)
LEALMAAPWEGQEAAEPGWVRASDADRERVVDLLKAAFVEGRLTMDELGERVGGALAARTHAELAMMTAGIPARVAVAAPLEIEPPETGPVRARHRPGPRTTAAACLVAATAGMFADAALTGANADALANLFYVLFIGGFVAAFIRWLCTLVTDREAPSTAQRPSGPTRPTSGGTA